MAYLIGDKNIAVTGDLSPEEQQIIAAHPHIFKYCLNSTAYKYTLSVKRIVHVYTDIITIYSTLLSKIPQYEDIRSMVQKAKSDLTMLEDDLNKVFGKQVEPKGEGWEDKDYERSVKPMTVVLLKTCCATFSLVFKTLNCIDVFFSTFENLKKLLIPCLLAHTQMVHKSFSGALFLFGLNTIVDDLQSVGRWDPTTVKQLTKIDSITSGIEREIKLLDMVFGSINPSLHQYTTMLLGKAILKRNIDDSECQIVRRREVCYQAAEHVVSIPLTAAPTSTYFSNAFPKHMIYFACAALCLFLAVLYRLYAVVFG